MTDKVMVTYVGGVDQVDVLFPSGDTRRITRGQTVELLARDAESLSEIEWLIAGEDGELAPAAPPEDPPADDVPAEDDAPAEESAEDVPAEDVGEGK